MKTFALVGYGYWGQFLTNEFLNLKSPDTQLEFCVEPNEKNARTAKAKLPWSVTDSLDDVLKAPQVDAVIIATPPATHYDAAAQALAAGKHVLVEKPVTADSKGARELVRLAAEKNKVLMVDDTYVFAPGVAALKLEMDKPEFGLLRKLYLTFQSLGKYQQSGVIWDLAPHTISVAAHLLGEHPSHVQAHGWTKRTNAKEQSFGDFDSAGVCLYRADGVPVEAELSWCDGEKVRVFAAVGTKQKIIYDDIRTDNYKLTIVNAGEDRIDLKTGQPFKVAPSTQQELATMTQYGLRAQPPVDLSQTPLRRMLNEFVTCVKTGKPSRLADGEKGFKTVRCIEAIYESIARDGAKIKVDYA